MSQSLTLLGSNMTGNTMKRPTLLKLTPEHTIDERSDKWLDFRITVLDAHMANFDNPTAETQAAVDNLRPEACVWDWLEHVAPPAAIAAEAEAEAQVEAAEAAEGEAETEATEPKLPLKLRLRNVKASKITKFPVRKRMRSNYKEVTIVTHLRGKIYDERVLSMRKDLD